MHNSNINFELHHFFRTDIICRVKAVVINLKLIKVNFINIILSKINL